MFLTRLVNFKGYNKSQLESLSEAIIENPLRPGKTYVRFSKGHPLMEEMRKKYPDAKTPTEPTIYDKLNQRTYQKLMDMTYNSKYGWSKELLLHDEGKTYNFPIDTSKYNYFDSKIPEAEKDVHWSEHIDFVNKNIGQFKGKDSGMDQIYFYLEGVGIGLAKNPYLTLEEKKDELARYIQYFKYQGKSLLALGILTNQTEKLINEHPLANRIILKYHWLKEGWTPRHARQDQRLTPPLISRAEYFWLKVPKVSDQEKLKKAFPMHDKRHETIRFQAHTKNEKITQISKKPDHMPEIVWNDDSNVCVIKSYKDSDSLSNFDFNSIEFEQIEFPNCHNFYDHPSQGPQLDAKGNATLDKSGKPIWKQRMKPDAKGNLAVNEDFYKKWHPYSWKKKKAYKKKKK